MKPNAIFLLLGVLGLCACGGGGKASGELPEPITLHADSIAVEQILAPQQIAVRGDVALILSQKTDTVFYAYGLPDFRFLYKQGVIGQGPDDFSYPTICPYPSDSIFAVSQIMKNEVGLYRIDREGFSEHKTLRSGKSGIRMMVNDSIAVVAENFWGQASLQPRLYVYNLSTGERTDSIPLQTYKGTIRLGTNISSLVNDYLCVGYGSHLVLAYSLMDRMEFYQITPQGKAVFEQAVGTEEHLSETLKKYAEQQKSFDKMQNFENTPMYYLFVAYATKDHLFIRNFSGRTPLQWQQQGKDGTLGLPLDVYTWEGKLVARLQLPAEGPFAVSEKYRKIYLIDSEKDFEYVYTFSYDF